MGLSAEATTDEQPAGEGRTMTGAHPIRHMLLFAGAVRATPLLKAAGRNVLDLPLTADQTVGQRWLVAHREFCEALGASPSLGVLTDRHSPKPASMPDDQASLEPDDVAFLGTGGVLRAAASGREGLMLVATGGSLLTRSLPDVVERLLKLDADVAMLAEHDGTPTGIMLLSVEVLRSMPGAGYLDFKEQCLPKIAQDHRVRVAFADTDRRACLPIRDREQYLAAVGHACNGEPFAIVERGAEVATSARMREAVVLRGARVGGQAVIARSVLGPSSNVGVGQVLTDRTMGGGA